MHKMKIETSITQLLGIDLPILQAGMSWASSNIPAILTSSQVRSARERLSALLSLVPMCTYHGYSMEALALAPDPVRQDGGGDAGPGTRAEWWSPRVTILLPAWVAGAADGSRSGAVSP